MNILELKKAVDDAIVHAIECGVDLSTVTVSLQIDREVETNIVESVWTNKNIELFYDNNLMASGAVITGAYAPF